MVPRLLGICFQELFRFPFFLLALGIPPPRQVIWIKIVIKVDILSAANNQMTEERESYKNSESEAAVCAAIRLS